MRLVFTVLFLSLFSQLCCAHSWNSMDVDVEVDDLELSAELLFDAGYGVPEWRNDTSISRPKLEWLENLSAKEQSALRVEAERYLREYLQFGFNGKPIDCRYEFPDWKDDPPQFPSHYDNDAYFRIVIRAQLDGEAGLLTLNTANGFYPQVSCVVNSKEKYLMLPGDSVDLVERTGGQQTETVRLSTVERILADLTYGFRHVIPAGMDHILFIIVMSLISLNLRVLLRLTLTFTLAHSITLALVSTDVIRLTPFLTGLIELLIALSIVALAIHSLAPKKRPQSAMWLIFVFGLIHGMGFANALREGLSQPEGFWLRLLFSNVGIEIAQILLILATLVCFGRVKSPYPKIISSIIILGVALFWSVDRMINL